MVTKKISKIIKKDVNYYLKLLWTYTIESDVDENGKH